MPATHQHSIVAIVLAAGQGTRMQSDLPKVMHRVAGRPMIAWVIDTAMKSGASSVVAVTGHGRREVEGHLKQQWPTQVRYAIQEEQRGTADAVRVGLSAIDESTEYVVVLYGDCPLIPASVIAELIEATLRQDAEIGIVTGELDDPSGYGRILRSNSNAIQSIREERDCSEQERAIKEVNPGIYCFRHSFIADAVSKLSTQNAQGEFYLTDAIELAAKKGRVVDISANMATLLGVNDPHELALARQKKHQEIADAHAKRGVHFRDTSSVYIDAESVIEAGAFIDIGCVIENSTIKAGAQILPHSVILESTVEENAHIGPFAHLRPGTKVGSGSKVGNFSETKKTSIGKDSKVNHLSYVGDGEIGDRVNIGAGTIFCNYDGVEKHQTIIEDDVFIGSDTQLIAPVRIGKGAYIASGATITKDVPEDSLAISRAKQENKQGYASKIKSRLAALKKKKT